MSGSRTATGAARVGSGAGRLVRAWRVMAPERRLAVYASIGLFLTLFLPWYQRQFFVVIGGKLAPASDSQTAWGAFSFVEAAVLLVAAGVLTLLFQRAEGKAFHLPGGDGLVIMIAGFWTCALVVWRIFDKQGGQAHGENATTYGIEWGIFIALAVAALLAYAGSRIRAAHQPEPPLPGEDDPPPGGWRAPSDPGPVAPHERAPLPAQPSPSSPADGPRRRRPPILDERQPDPSAGRRQPDPSAGRRQPDPSAGRRRPDTPEGRRRPDASQAETLPRRPRADEPGSPGDSRERRVGWLTGPPRHAVERDDAPAADEWPAPEWPPAAAGRPNRPPRPVPADDAATIRATRNPSPLPPSTPAAQRRQQPDEELTTPFERED